MPNVICFDLEGPLSPQDNAYEVMGLIENGYRIFEVLSRYDDILTLEGKKGYEPGDTLSLIIPFLLKNGISEEDILDVSMKAMIVDGVKELFSIIRKDWEVYVISTSYQQHAFNIAGQLGIPRENVYSTRLPLEDLYRRIDKKDLKLVENIEGMILKDLENANDREVKSALDSFYEELSKTSLKVLDEVKVVGGERKLQALKLIAGARGKRLEEIVVVGDSITDFKMLQAVKNSNGTAVVFNGNKYALPYGSIGLACSSMLPLLIVLDAFSSGGPRKAESIVSKWQENGEIFLENPEDIPPGYIPDKVREFLVESKNAKGVLKPDLSLLSNLNDKEREKLVSIHSKARKHVRGEAGKLG